MVCGGCGGRGGNDRKASLPFGYTSQVDDCQAVKIKKGKLLLKTQQSNQKLKWSNLNVGYLKLFKWNFLFIKVFKSKQ